MSLAPLLLLGIVPALAPDVAATPSGAPVRFSRHVVPLFSRLGCNAGSCHGAVKGQNGFRLSLFGADPARDHDHLLRDAAGRRVDRLDPDASLLLLKATGRVPHQGGKRMDVGSPEYRLFRAWIAAGAPLDAIEASRVTNLEVTPGRHTLRTGESYAIRVQANFADGSTEDVTDLSTFESRDRSVAEVGPTGQVRGVGPGDAALVARFRGQPALAMVFLPGEAKGAFPEVVARNFIDKHVLAKLHTLNIHPADLCDDATFLRRVMLDVTGALPTPEEVRAFHADTSPEKRAKKIEELLARPGHAALWATKFCDLLKPTGFDPKLGLTEAAEARRFYEWVRARLLENTPYDQFAERILLATSREGRPEDAWNTEVRSLIEESQAPGADLTVYAGRKTLDLYWQRTNATGVKGTLQVAHAFLGLRLECAQCHRHPHDVWQQDDLLSFANFFSRVGVGSGVAPKKDDPLAAEVKELREKAKKLTDMAKGMSKEEMARLQAEAKALTERAKVLEETGKRVRGEIHGSGKPVFASVTSPLGMQKSETFRLLGASAATPVPADRDPRELVVAWMRAPDNPFFARAIVNRVWAHYFGRGIIDPPDHLSPLNPASHPELLAELCKEFVAHGYDLKYLHRLILNSRTYQQSAKTNATSRNDTANYASFYLRRLPAEVLVDAVNHATGGRETYPPELFLPAAAKAVEVAGGTGSERARASLQYAFQIFGRPVRSPDVQCDCERDTRPTIVQTLFLANHPAVQEKIAAPAGRVASILKEFPTDERRIEEVFLWTLSRLPVESEREACTAYLKEAPTPERGLRDVLWGLLNTREFLLNH
jgi:hypothetical protein